MGVKKYFNYFGPWTADVQGPLLNSCEMNVVMTTLAGRPVKNRQLPRALPSAHPRAQTSSFSNFFTALPGQLPKYSQTIYHQRFNNLTNYPINHLTNLPRPPGQPPLGIPWWNFGLVKMALSLHSS